MIHQNLSRLLFLVLFLSIVCGCTYPISRELRDEARADLTYPMVLNNPEAYAGAVVIWGGRIIETLNRREGTEIMVLDLPLDYEKMPEAEFSPGRFIAKTAKFLDPEVYKPGRMVTVAGEITGKETRAVGELKYAYPVIAIKQIHLWRREQIYVYPPYYYGWGWYGPYGPYGPYRPYWPYRYWGY